MWVGFAFNLGMSLLFAGYLLRAVRRFGRRADAIMERMDRMRYAEAGDQELAWANFRAEVRASMRSKVDAAIAELNAEFIDYSIAPHGNGYVNSEMAISPRIHSTFPTASALPTVDEIFLLSEWAIVAYAARCARRVLPLFSHYWPHPHPDYSQAIERTVEFSEVAGRLANGDFIPHFDFHSGVCTATDAANAAGGGEMGLRARAKDAAFAAAYAGDAAGYAQIRATAARSASDSALDAAQEWNICETVRCDFDTLYANTLASKSTDPIPPSIFGPLWPEGSPEGWPESERPAKELRFELEVPDDMSDDDAIEFVKRLSVELCKLHVAGGGHGIAIRPPLEMDVPYLANKPTPEPALA